MNARIDKKAMLVEIFNQHWYKIDDNIYFPSVTGVLDAKNKGVQYQMWLKDLGHNVDLVMKRAAERGSYFHYLIENFLLNGEIKFEQFISNNFNSYIPIVDDWKHVVNWVNWYNSLEIQAEFSETIVYSREMRIGGTADFIGIIKGERWLLDWKSSPNEYSTHKEQVSAYAKMWNALNPNHQIVKAGICYIGTKNKTQKDLSNVGIKLLEVDIDTYFEKFKRTLAVFDDDYRTNPPQLVYPLELKLKTNVITGGI